MKNSSQALLVDTFREPELLVWSAEFIAGHATNDLDVRQVALHGLDLGGCREILDLGCAFGFTTRALKDRVHPAARIKGVDLCQGYRDLFLKASAEAGLAGEFCAMDISALAGMPARTFDLVLCSYALYFFPEALPDIARLLKDTGIFITITHTRAHMAELSRLIRKCFLAHGRDPGPRLPIENLLRVFNNENGLAQLTPWFAETRQTDYRNSLVISRDSLADLIQYIRFKRSFFIPETQPAGDGPLQLIQACLAEQLARQAGLVIAKDDTIFVCKKPRQPRDGLQNNNA